MGKFPFTLAVLVLALPPIYAGAEQQRPSAIPTLANQCGACHGTYGDTQSSIPRLNVISGEKLYEALRAFRSGERPSTIMGRVVAGMTDEELLEISRFYFVVH